MGIAIKQSTASQEVPLGYFLDSTDGDTEETGLTIANTDIKLWKNGATTLANKNSGGATHISNGVYYCTLDATDTNTVGPMIIFVHVSGALAVRLECHVYEEDIYDALFGSGAAGFDSNQRVDVGEWLGQAVTLSTGNKPDVNIDEISDDATAAVNLEIACDNYSVTRGLTGTALPAAAADAAGGLPISDVGGLDLDSKLANTNEITAARMSELDVGTVGKMANQVDEIRTDTEDIQTKIGTPANIDTGGATIADNLKKIADDSGGAGFDATTDSLEAIRNRGDAEWITATSVTVSDKTGFSLSNAGIDAIWDRNASIAISFETLVERIYQLLNNEMNITNATGAVALRNLADSADMATGSITDNGTTTSRTAYSWV